MGPSGQHQFLGNPECCASVLEFVNECGGRYNRISFIAAIRDMSVGTRRCDRIIDRYDSAWKKMGAIYGLTCTWM
jgi:hypothetical protein